ncbi:MAG: hypothetical protein D6765_17220 [Bacteroidetes bacterium]|nr:MAG: hypothetical protein D6765_17220 [Bacteroidota bacterium]
MKKLLFRLGVLSLVAFVGTGLYLRWNVAGLSPDDLLRRMMFRANHIYILLCALTLLALSFGVRPSAHAGRRRGQRLATLLCGLTALGLIAAFFLDPATGSLQRDLTRFSLIGFLSGAATHLAVLHFEGAGRS